MNCLIFTSFKISIFAKPVLLLALSLFVASSAFALDCGDPSPTLTREGGDTYYVYAPMSVEPQQAKALDTLKEDLIGHWIGTAKVDGCEGPEDSVEMKSSEFNIEADISINKFGQLKLRLERESLDGRQIDNKTVEILEPATLVHLGVAEDGLEAIEKVRWQRRLSAEGPVTSRLIEIISLVKRKHNKLAIDLVYFSNGEFFTRHVYRFVSD